MHASWSGRAPGEFRIGGHAGDYAALAENGTALVVHFRVDQYPTQPVRVGVRCEAPYGTRTPANNAGSPVDWRLCGTPSGSMLDLTAEFRSAPLGSWRTLTVPYACIAKLGANLANVNALFALESAGRLAVSCGDIRLARPATAPVCRSRGP